jgi:PAS domain S-box-containing protein
MGERLFKEGTGAIQSSIYEQEFEQFLELLPGAAFLREYRTGRILFVNRYGAALLGYEPAEIEKMGADFTQNTMHPDDLARGAVHEEQLQTLADGQNLEFEYRLRQSDGQWRWFLSRESVVRRDRSGNPELIIGLAQDITGRKNAEETRAWLAAVVESSGDAIYSYDLQGRILNWNKSAEKLFGYAETEIVGRHVTTLVPPELFGDPERIIGAIKKGEYLVSFETTRKRKDGTTFDALLTASPIFGIDGRPAAVSAILRDITARRAEEDKLRQSEATLRSYYESAPVFMGITEIIGGADILHVYDNPAACRFFGVEKGQTAGHLSSELGAPPKTRSEWIKYYRESEMRQAPVSFEYRFQGDSGEKSLAVTVSPIDRGSSRRTRFCYIAQDISVWVYTEQALIKSVRQQDALFTLADGLHRARSLDEIFSASLDAIVTALECDRASILLYDENKIMRFVAWRGLPEHYRRQAEGHSPWPPEERDPQPVCIADIKDAEVEENLKKVIIDEGIAALAFIPLVLNGSLIGKFMAYSDRPRVFQENDLELGLTVSRQLVFGIERQRTESARRESEERLRLATESAQIYTWQYDLATGNAVFSQNVEHVLGFALPTNISQLPDAVHPDDRTQLFADFSASLSGEKPLKIEYRYVNPNNGRTVWVQSQGSLLLNERQKPIHLIGITQNITERKIAEEERDRLLRNEQNARIEAERANRLKDEFLATVSHELRTPLNAILGWSRMAQSSQPADETVKRALEIIIRSAKTQNQIIEDILDVSRIITGKIRLNMRRVDLSRIIEAALDTVRPALEAKNIRLTTGYDLVAGSVVADPDRLQQIVWNLVSNAAKFTPENGQIEVTTGKVENYAEITVRDSGMGISPEFLPYVFDRFRQAEGGTNRKYGGLGLGLAVVRHLVELHGGNVSVHSEGVGKGAIFVVRLPLVPVQSEVIELISPSKRFVSFEDFDLPHMILLGLSVMIVDDEADSRELVRVVLSQYGAQVMLAASAREALEQLRKTVPDILISDIGMPEMDGYELIREVRSHPPTAGVKALALTAYAREEDQQAALSSGFDAYLSKPVEVSELIKTLADLLKKKAS